MGVNEGYQRKKEEADAWVASLIPGDKVLYIGFAGKYEDILEVQKVTPSGIVRTNKGSFKRPEWSASAIGYGRDTGYIVPATDDGIQQATEYINAKIAERMKNETIRSAKTLCYSVYAGAINISYDDAAKIIALLDSLGANQKRT